MLLCVLECPTFAEVEKEAKEASRYTSSFELRLDALLPEEFEKIKPLPGIWIYTFRKASQGGLRQVSEEERLSLLAKALLHNPTYCDIEADTENLPLFVAAFPHVQWIGSHHDFDGMPRDLSALFASMERPFFYAYKIAVRVANSLELFRLFRWAKEKQPKRLTVLGLGPFGTPGRVLAPTVGNFAHYAGLEEKKEPLVRPSLATLIEQFHFAKIDAETTVYALLGDPVAQSPGDRIHNQWFREKGKNCLYVKFSVQKEELSELLFLAKELSFRGFSVTMPLKEAIVPHLDHLTPEAKAIGRVNTVFLLEGKWWGANTDGQGAIQLLGDIRGRRLSLLGTGATAQAIAYEAKRAGADVLCYGRSRGDRPFQAAWEEPHDLLVSTLPLASQYELLRQGRGFQGLSARLALDVAYGDQKTPFCAALEGGCPTLPGLSMWQSQALLQQRLWDFCESKLFICFDSSFVL